MTHATTHNMNTPRRAHPAAVRASLRSHAASASSHPTFDFPNLYRPKLDQQSATSQHQNPALKNGSATRIETIPCPQANRYATLHRAHNVERLLAGIFTRCRVEFVGSLTINSYQWTVPSQITLPGGTVRNQQYDGLLRLKNLSVKDPGQSQVMNYQNRVSARITHAVRMNSYLQHLCNGY